MSPSLRLLAPAKINLHLRVGPPTSDGFHPLLSWMCTIGLFDTLTIDSLPARPLPPMSGEKSGRTPSREGSSGSDAPGSAGAVAAIVPPVIQLSCDDASLPCDGNNLIVRAGAVLADAIAKQTGRENLSGLAARLEKRIPMGGGLGGGSSDGARMLLGLNQLWAAGLDRATLAALSSKLGSDLPFFCYGASSICTGRGEFVRSTPRPASRWVLLVLPDIHMPTPAVFRRFDQLGLGDLSTLKTPPDWVDWSHLPAAQLLPLLVNDLEAPAFSLRPDLRECRDLMEELSGRAH